MTETFDQWLDREAAFAATAMLKSVSAVDLVKTRPGFGQTVRPVKGSIIASPVIGAYDPDPDYFFHWYRDSAVVIDALRLLFLEGVVGAEALEHFADFLRFGLSLQKLDGRALAASSTRRDGVAPDFLKFIRDDDDLAAVHGDAAFAETRVNPDGSLDISKWARPQHDGPPLQALALMRWARDVRLAPAVSADLSALIRANLEFTLHHCHEPSFDIWEEENGLHYYTLRVSAAALEQGAEWFESQGESGLALCCLAEAAKLVKALDGLWLAEENCYRSRTLVSGARSSKELDIAVILAAVHVEARDQKHSVSDPRMQATLARLEKLFDGLYAINRNRPADRGPAMGRYPGDVYYSGGAYYFSTLGASEFCFRAAMKSDQATSWIARGDAYLATVRAYTPASGDLSEQFDQGNGRQTSAKHLAWSYAAFISCIAARRAAVGQHH